MLATLIPSWFGVDDMDIGESIVARGERLVVITSLTLSAAIPEDRSCFDGVTNHGAQLFQCFALGCNPKTKSVSYITAIQGVFCHFENYFCRHVVKNIAFGPRLKPPCRIRRSR